jgi:hypothetical protein
MSFFISESLVGKIDTSLIENSNSTIQVKIDDNMYNINTVDFNKENTVDFDIKCNLMQAEELFFNKELKIKLFFTTKLIKICDYNVKSINYVLDHDNSDKYIVKINAKYRM